MIVKRLVIVALAAALLPGCGTSPAHTDEPVPLVFVTFARKDIQNGELQAAQDALDKAATYGESPSAIAAARAELTSAKAQQDYPAALKVTLVKWTVSSGYDTITGSIHNTGNLPVRYVKIRVDMHDSAGQTIDTSWTYGVDSVDLQPDASKTFDIMLRHNDAADKSVAKVISWRASN